MRQGLLKPRKESEMKYTHVIWDFNGTIFADMDAGIVSVNKMLEERGLPVIPSIEHYREIFDFPIIDYYKGLGFDFEKESYETILAPMWVELYNINAQSSTLVDGVKETIERIKELGLCQSVISACEQEMLERYLKGLGVYDYFDEVMGLDNIHAGSKTHLAKDWRARHPEAKILFIGDTTHDAETAVCMGGDCVLFAGGHQSRAKLEKTGYSVIEKMPELINFVM